MTKGKAKKELLAALADLLDRDDALLPEAVDDGTREYETWDKARTELSAELRSRAYRKTKVHP